MSNVGESRNKGLRALVLAIAPVLVLSGTGPLFGQSTAGGTSSAFGEQVKLVVSPLGAVAVEVASGPLPTVSGTAPAPYNNTNSVASVNVGSVLTGPVLQTALLHVHAGSNIPTTFGTTADASVATVNLNVLGLVTIMADLIQSKASIAGACGGATSTGSTSLVNARIGGSLGLSGTLAANPAPNTVLLNAAGVKVILNEQVVSGSGSDKTLTVNAVHITLTNAPISTGVVSGDIIISQSRAQAQCTIGSADLSIVKTSSPNPVAVGAELAYSIAVTNAGPHAATNVIVSDTLPAGAVFVKSEASQGTCSGTTAVTCKVGTINVGSSATVKIVVKVTSVVNKATVKATELDTNKSNNTATNVTNLQ